MKITRKLIPKNEMFGPNNDHTGLISALKLSDRNLIDHLHQTGNVAHILVTELIRYTEENRARMYPCVIDVCLGPFNFILMLTYDPILSCHIVESVGYKSISDR